MNIKNYLSFSPLRTNMSEIFSNIPDLRQQKKISVSQHDEEILLEFLLRPTSYQLVVMQKAPPSFQFDSKN